LDIGAVQHPILDDHPGYGSHESVRVYCPIGKLDALRVDISSRIDFGLDVKADAFGIFPPQGCFGVALSRSGFVIFGVEGDEIEQLL